MRTASSWRQVGLLGVLVGGLGAVDGDDREMGGGVGLGGEVLGVLGGAEAVLGGEDRRELRSGCCGGVDEDVDGADAVGVDAGLVGEEAEAEGGVGIVGEGLEGGEVGGFEDVDAGEGVG